MNARTLLSRVSAGRTPASAIATGAVATLVAVVLFLSRGDAAVVTLELASQPGACTGFFEGWLPCLQVRDGDEWQGRSSQIEGFDYEPGYRYRIQVRRVEIDVSGYEDDRPDPYHDELVRVVLKERVIPLTITIAANRASIPAGEGNTFSYRVRNDLPISIRLLKVELPVPEGAAFAAAEPAGARDPTSGVWRIEYLDPGDEAALDVTFTVPRDFGGSTLEVLARATSINHATSAEEQTLSVPIDAR